MHQSVVTKFTIAGIKLSNYTVQEIQVLQNLKFAERNRHVHWLTRSEAHGMCWTKTKNVQSIRTNLRQVHFFF